MTERSSPIWLNPRVYLEHEVTVGVFCLELTAGELSDGGFAGLLQLFQFLACAYQKLDSHCID